MTDVSVTGYKLALSSLDREAHRDGLGEDISMLGKCLGVSRRKYSPWLQTEDQVSISNMKAKLEL